MDYMNMELAEAVIRAKAEVLASVLDCPRYDYDWCLALCAEVYGMRLMVGEHKKKQE